jgi:hypothetical protein
VNTTGQPTFDDIRRALVSIGDLSFLLRPQQREISEWLDAQSQIVSVIHASRGYGKTYFSLVKALEKGLVAPNQRIVFACPTREQATKIAVPTMAMLKEALTGLLEIKQQTTGHQYILPNGSVIILEGADDDRGNHLRGPFAHFIICDEAGFWRHCDYVVRSVLLPQAQRCGGRLVAISTSPESTGHEFVELCARATRTNSYLRRTIDDNQYITSEEKSVLIEELGGPTATATRRELYCEFVVEENRAVIPEFSEAKHVFTDETQVPIWRDRYVAMDLGFNDDTHAVFAWWDWNNACLVVEDELRRANELTSKIVELVQQKEKDIWGKHKPYMRIADNDLQILHDMAALGLSFSPATKTDKEAAINSLRSMFAQGKIKIHARCVNLILQLKVGIWNNQRTGYDRLPGVGHLDGIDALVYLNRRIDRNRNPQPETYGYANQTHFIPPNQKKTKRAHALKGILGAR